MAVEYLGPLEPKKNYDAEVYSEATRQGIDPDLAVAVHRTEYSPKKWVSDAGAVGPMQLMPGTAKDMGAV